MITDAVARLAAAYGRALGRASEREPELAPFAAAVATIDALAARPQVDRPVTHPALHMLPRALAGLRAERELRDAINGIMPHLRWSSTYRETGPGAQVARHMTWGEIAGRGALVDTDRFRLGCFLLAPGLVYPLHGHEAAEVYSVVSGRLRVTHGFAGDSHLVEAPGHSVTPSGMAHALEAGAEPVLIVYVWTGELTKPTWWWEKDAAGRWQRFHPDRG